MNNILTRIYFSENILEFDDYLEQAKCDVSENILICVTEETVNSRLYDRIPSNSASTAFGGYHAQNWQSGP